MSEAEAEDPIHLYLGYRWEQIIRYKGRVGGASISHFEIYQQHLVGPM